MEQHVNNLINFGIGCFKALSGGYGAISDRVKTGVGDLIIDGENVKSDTAVKIREIAHKATDLFRRGEKTQKARRAA